MGTVAVMLPNKRFFSLCRRNEPVAHMKILKELKCIGATCFFPAMQEVYLEKASLNTFAPTDDC